MKKVAKIEIPKIQKVVLNVLVKAGEKMNARDVSKKSKLLKNTTIRVHLARLERKGLVVWSEVANDHRYHWTATKAGVNALAS